MTKNAGRVANDHGYSLRICDENASRFTNDLSVGMVGTGGYGWVLGRNDGYGSILVSAGGYLWILVCTGGY